jgi:hypothetical protein
MECNRTRVLKTACDLSAPTGLFFTFLSLGVLFIPSDWMTFRIDKLSIDGIRVLLQRLNLRAVEHDLNSVEVVFLGLLKAVLFSCVGGLSCCDSIEYSSTSR